MADTRTRAQQNRAIRQQELRDKLAAGGHIDHAIENANKMLEAEDYFELNKYKAVFDAQMKLAGKYLPDLKATEVTGEGGEALTVVISSKDASLL